MEDGIERTSGAFDVVPGSHLRARGSGELRPPLAYLVALTSTAAAVLLRLALDPWLGDELALVTLYGAVALTVWVGGLWPATLAAAAGFLACNVLFVAPRGLVGLFAADDWIGLAAYVVSSGAIIALGEGLRRARRRAEQELEARRRSSERFQQLVETAREGIWAIDLDRRVTYVNPRMAALLGTTVEALMGIDSASLIHPEDAARGMDRWEDRLLGEATSDEWRFRRADGSYLWTHSSGAPLRDADGRVVGSFALVTDISASKDAEEALRRSRDVLALAMRGGRMGAWSRDLLRDEVWWSSELEELFGLPPGSFAGKRTDFLALMHVDDRPAMAAAVEDSIRTGNDYAVEFRFRHASGEWRWMEGRGRTLLDATGRPVMLHGIGMEITERKRAEEALREADRRKDEFLATLAHELRNPLAPIRNSVEILRLRGGDDPLVVRARDVIDRQARQLTHLVDDLLDVSRITQGKVRLRRQPLQVAGVLAEVIEGTRSMVEAAGHQLALMLPEEPAWVDADTARLFQVIYNLVNNAAKYTPRGGHLAIEVGRHEDDVVITVRDDGIGIPAEHLPRIFDMFSQVTPALERSQGGLGIGLALVRGLVELHGGRVEARSDGAGKGSEFSIWLPELRMHGAGPRAEVSRAVTDGEGSAPRRVLVVDDNRDAAESLAAMLSLMGHEVYVAHDGPEAVLASGTLQPDVILLDIGLPKMNGYDVARRIREERGAAVTLVAITGWGQEEDRRRATVAGFDQHLTKPVEREQLERVLGS